jgi:hypothetical protein
MNENVEKLEWTTPEIVDLDIDKTSSGVPMGGSEGTPYQPYS